MVYRYQDSEFTTYNGFYILFRFAWSMTPMDYQITTLRVWNIWRYILRIVGNSWFKGQRNKLQKCTSFICCIKIWAILQQIEVMCVQLRCRQGKAVLFYGIAHTIDTFEL